MNKACVGYCGGYHPVSEMRSTFDGKMCDDCYAKLQETRDNAHAFGDNSTER